MVDLNSIHKVYAVVKKDIIGFYNNKKYAHFIRLCDLYANVVREINDILVDDEIEELLRSFSIENIERKSSCEISYNPKRIVLYDQIGTTVCLGLQYLRGLIDSGYEVLYIYESQQSVIDKNLLNELVEKKVNFFIHQEKKINVVLLANEIRKEIIDFGAKKLIIQSPASGALGCAVLYSLPNITKYRVVPGDHHFYLGVKCVDYFFEFRNYGVYFATQRRGIRLEQIYKNPYYPIISEFDTFHGFPFNIKNKIVILTGGAEYKFFGSELFFDVVNYLVSTHLNVVVLFAGKASKKMAHKFSRIDKFHNRIFCIGYRSDFSNCMKNCDIFLSSYPSYGGLISQIAAYYKKPIIAYCKIGLRYSFNSIKSLIGCEDAKIRVTKEFGTELFAYIDHLVKSKQFRDSEGLKLYDCLVTKELFNKNLASILSGKIVGIDGYSSSSFQNEEVSKVIIPLNLRLQNELRPTVLGTLTDYYGANLFWKFKFLLTDVFSHLNYVFFRLLVHIRNMFRH